MAAYHSTFLIALIFISSKAMTVSHGLQLPDGSNVLTLSVIGRLVCGINATSLSEEATGGIAGVNVFVSCDGGRSSLGQAITDLAGFFEVILKSLDGILFDPSVCKLFVKLPIGGCALYPPTGTLQALPVLLGVVQSSLGAVARFAVGCFGLVVTP